LAAIDITLTAIESFKDQRVNPKSDRERILPDEIRIQRRHRATRRGRNAVIKLVLWKIFVIRQSYPETFRTSTSSGTNGSKPAASRSNRACHERIYSAVP
jgi:hypothetical protein